MIRIIQPFLAITFPWAVLLIHDDPVGAFIALIMQATMIGWLPASVWAWRTMNKKQQTNIPPTKTKTPPKPGQEN